MRDSDGNICGPCRACLAERDALRAQLATSIRTEDYQVLSAELRALRIRADARAQERDAALAELAKLKEFARSLWAIIDYRRYRILWWQARARAWKRAAAVHRLRYLGKAEGWPP